MCVSTAWKGVISNGVTRVIARPLRPVITDVHRQTLDTDQDR